MGICIIIKDINKPEKVILKAKFQKNPLIYDSCGI
jgi:hypothetical protein